MGRRKIEIQPITHERNRSVTFLKRKNGLFKKAYELGVLCSVDVAVIIFEERPGHHVKLYQYCSTDVQGMVQRHLRFDGEKDTRTPVDFSNTKHEEPVDDDEEGDDDDATGAGRQKKDTKSHLKPKDSSHTNGHSHTNGSSNVGGVPIRPAHPTDVSSHGIDLDYRSANSRMHNGSANGMSDGLSVSGRRGSRPGNLNLGSLNLNNNSMSGMGMPLPVPVPMPPLPPSKRQRLDDLAPNGITYPYRLDVDLGTYPPTAMATSLANSGSANGHSNGNGNSNTQGLSGLFSNGQQNGGYSNGGSLAQSGFEQYQGQRRGVPSYGVQGQGYGSMNGGSGGMYGGRPNGPTSANMLVDLLNASSEAQGGGGGFGGFEWPVTSGSGQPEVPNSNDPTSWLDFLTTNASQTPTNSNSLSIGLPTPTASSRAASGSVSSVGSGRGAPYGMPSASSSTDSLSMRMSPARKRTRDESDLESDLRIGAAMQKIAVGGGGEDERRGLV